MKWLASVRAMLAGGSRSAPVTPAASPNMPSRADLHAKRVSCKHVRMLDLESRMFTVVECVLILAICKNFEQLVLSLLA